MIPQPVLSSRDVVNPITIEEFKADPPTVAPFGSAVLSWRIKNLPAGTKVTINSVEVADEIPAGDVVHSGKKTISPKLTQNYKLVAGGASKTITVKVNVAECVVRENGFAAQFMKFLLQRLVDDDPTLTFFKTTPLPPEPSIVINPTRIRFNMVLTYDDGKTFPPLIAAVAGSFGLKIVNVSPALLDNKVVASDINIAVTPFPLPGFPLGFPDGIKEDIVAKKIRDSIPQLADFAVKGFAGEPADKEPHNVVIGPGGLNDQGTVITTYCSKQPVIAQA